MKTRLTTLAASVLLLHSANTLAASSVDLTVKGLIVPSACTPSLSGGGVIDHGKISAKDLKPDNPTVIGNHTLILAVNCDAPIKEKFWDSGLYMSVAAMDDDSQPLPVKDLLVDLQVNTFIMGTAGMDLSNEVTIDGSATLEVKYL